MNLGEYMRKVHPAPLTYLPPQKAKGDLLKLVPHLSIPTKHLDMARAFVMVSIVMAFVLPGKWAILASVVGNAYWLYKIR